MSTGKFDDLIGKEFNLLKVISFAGIKNKHRMWNCECRCGNLATVRESNLKNGHTRSCGCLNDPKSVFHYTNGTRIESIMSDKVYSSNISGIRGVHYDKSRNLWQAQITFQQKTYTIGRYSTIEEAAHARKEAENAMFGDFLVWFSQIKANAVMI